MFSKKKEKDVPNKRNTLAIRKICILGFLIAVLAICILFVRNNHTIGDQRNAATENNESDDSIFYKENEDSHVRKDEGSGSEYIDNQLLVLAETGITKDQVAELIAPYDAEIVGYIQATDTYQIEFPAGHSKTELKQMGAELEKNPEIDHTMLNMVLHTEASVK